MIILQEFQEKESENVRLTEENKQVCQLILFEPI